MDFFAHFLHLPGFDRLSKRIQKVPLFYTKKIGTFRRKAQALLLIIAAIGLGIWAKETTELEALQSWQLSHLPQRSVWEHGLGARGFKPLNELRLLQEVTRSLPTSLDDLGTVWISSNSYWVAIALPAKEKEALPQEAPERLQIYCLKCTKSPMEWKNWETLDRGWTGFEKSLSRIDRLPKQATLSQSPRKKQKVWDPREIRY